MAQRYQRKTRLSRKRRYSPDEADTLIMGLIGGSALSAILLYLLNLA